MDSDSGKDSFRIFHGGLHGDFNFANAIEAFGFLDGDIHGEDGHSGAVDFALGEFIFNSHGALGFDLDGMAQFFGGLFQLFGGHVSVGDAGGASSDSDDFHGLAPSATVVFSVSFFTELMAIAVANAPARMAMTYMIRPSTTGNT